MAKVSRCKETVWHTHGAHKVSELSVYALETDTTQPTEIDHPTAEPLPDAPCRAQDAVAEGEQVANSLWATPARPACPAAIPRDIRADPLCVGLVSRWQNAKEMAVWSAPGMAFAKRTYFGYLSIVTAKR
jgi:hypothetical protein